MYNYYINSSDKIMVDRRVSRAEVRTNASPQVIWLYLVGSLLRLYRLVNRVDVFNIGPGTDNKLFDLTFVRASQYAKVTFFTPPLAPRIWDYL